MNKRNKIRLKDISDELGISVMSVSRALRDQPDVGQKTKDLVKKTAAKMGYMPDYWAKNTRKRSGEKGIGNIAYIYRGNRYGFFSSDFLSGIREIFSGKDQFISWFTIDQHPRDLTVDDLPVALRQRMADGIIIEFDVNDEIKAFLKSLSIPIVYLYCNVHEEYDCVWHDEYYAAKTATEHLLASGYNKIFMQLGYPHTKENAHQYFIDREKGCRDVLEKNGLELNLLLYDKPTIKFIKENKGHAASITGMLTYLTALEARFQMPKDLGVIDIDMPFQVSGLFNKITRIPIDRFELGRIAAEKLLKKISSGKPQASFVNRPAIIINNTVRAKKDMA